MRLDVYDTDDFSPLPRQEGDIWIRKDLNQIRAFYNDAVRILFAEDGTPGKLPDNVVRR